MRTQTSVSICVIPFLLLLWLLPGCKGGGAGIVLGDLSGTWLETYVPTNDPAELVIDEPGDVLLAKVSDTSYTVTEADPMPGDLSGTLLISGTSFSTTNSFNAPFGANAVYKVSWNITGTASESQLTGSGTMTLDLVSGTDDEGLDGYIASFDYTLEKQQQ